MQDYFTATFRVRSTVPLARAAEFLAVMETAGSWPHLGPPTALFRSCQGSVGAVRELTGDTGEVEIRFPLINLNLAEPFQSVWLAATSGYAPAALHLEARLVGLDLPPDLLKAFPGPRFGAEGIRRWLGVPPGQLLIGTIVKPVAGLTPDEVAADVYSAASAGVQFIKDDQKMLNPPYCPLQPRVEAVRKALDRAQAETGRRTLYAPNISAGGDRLMRNALAALEAGADALMVTFMSTGLEALGQLATDPRIRVPVYAHCGGKELMTRPGTLGVDEAVLGLLVRLMGGDLLRVSAVGGDLVHSSPAEVARLQAALTGDAGPHGPVLPAVSGGLGPHNLHHTLAVCGTDILVLAGRGIAAHPRGIPGGVAAFRAAEEAYARGVAVQDWARERPVLAEALGEGKGQ